MVSTGTPPSDPVNGGDESRDRTAEPRPRLQNEGGTADDHGRRPGVPSRTGTGAVSGQGHVEQPPADGERVRRADAADTANTADTPDDQER